MSDRKKVTLRTLFKKVEDGVPITMLTCYDYPTAHFQEQAGVDMILVGDSLGMTMLGYDSTLPVTMNDMIRHTQAVRRGSPNAWLLGDMPYMSYQPSVETAIRSAGRFMAEASCDAIKLEGGAEIVPQIKGILAAGIPVMGHLGLTPQSVSALGGFRVQGKGAVQAKKIMDDANIIPTFQQLGSSDVALCCPIVTEAGSIPEVHSKISRLTSEYYGMAVRFGDEDLLHWLNLFIEQTKTTIVVTDATAETYELEGDAIGQPILSALRAKWGL